MKSKPSHLRRTISSCSTILPEDIASRLSSDANIKRSSLSRASSISSLPSPGNFESGDIIARNKNVVSRVVMAGLRLNGLQPQKSRSRLRRQSTVDSKSIADGENSAKEVEADDISDEPFKTMYHIVLKATIHTFVSLSVIYLGQSNADVGRTAGPHDFEAAAFIP